MCCHDQASFLTLRLVQMEQLLDKRSEFKTDFNFIVQCECPSCISVLLSLLSSYVGAGSRHSDDSSSAREDNRCDGCEGERNLLPGAMGLCVRISTHICTRQGVVIIQHLAI